MAEIVGYPNNGWKKDLIAGWDKAFETTESTVRLDMSDTEFVTLFDWLTVVALIEKTLANSSVNTFEIDLKGSAPVNHTFG